MRTEDVMRADGGPAMARPTRNRLAVVLTGAVALLMILPSPAGAAPLRSGTIVGGLPTGGPSHVCEWAPDCMAWLESGCDPALTGHDPAWLTSIEDVAGLADGTTPRVFELRLGHQTGVAGVGIPWGGVMVQFWGENCGAEIPSSGDGWRTDYGPPTPSPVGPLYLHVRRFTTFPIPSGAKWMTVVGNSSVNIEWNLT